MNLNSAEKRELFIKIFTREFIREFQFLADVMAGRSQRRSDLTDKILKKAKAARAVIKSIPVVGGIMSAGVAGISAAVEISHEKKQKKRIKHIATIFDQADLIAVEILAAKVAREAALRYEYFMTVCLTDDDEIGVIPFAKCGVARVLGYVACNNATLNEENLLQGFVEGFSGVVSTSNTKIGGKGRHKDLCAEGAYAVLLQQNSTIVKKVEIW